MQFRFPRLTPTVKKLLIFLGAMFVAVSVVQIVADVPVFQWLALRVSFTDGQLLGLAWQPLTYWAVEPPVPGSLLNVALTLLMIYFFLSPFEEAFGPKRALQLAGVGIVAGALAAVALAFVWPRAMPVSGASVIAAASFGAFPTVFRGREIILFPLMIPLKAWTAVLIGLGITALMSLLNRDPYIFAMDASAIGAGFGFAKWMTRPRTPKSDPKKRRRRSGPDLKVLRGGADDDDRPRWLN
ncbi:MAG TPA: rhomboid family intramembrane serine protease [Sandaracinaceae bacterium LLY-WYZ-13_1]|nr:rhomboid family intramembrane serine protease [Sandaracinaceae bacterium LLY-WYZ-13_1]